MAETCSSPLITEQQTWHNGIAGTGKGAPPRAPLCFPLAPRDSLARLGGGEGHQGTTEGTCPLVTVRHKNPILPHQAQ